MVLIRSHRWLLWVCVPEWALLFNMSQEFFIHPHPVGGPQNGDTFLQCLLWSKFGGSWSTSQCIKILNSGSYLQNVSPDHSSASCAVSYLLRISGNSSNLTWISLSFRSFASVNFGTRVRSGLATGRRLIQHISPYLLLNYGGVSLTCKDGRWADDDVLQIQGECGVLVQALRRIRSYQL